MILFDSLDPEDAMKLNEVIARELKAELQECETRDGEWDFAVHYDRFPPFTWVQQKERCNRVLPELYHMAIDGYDHRITPLLEFVLTRCLAEWKNVAEDRAAETKDPADNAYYQDLEYFNGGEPFEDSVLDNLENLANAVLRGRVNLLDDFGVTRDELQAYYEVMPEDVTHGIEREFAKSPG